MQAEDPKHCALYRDRDKAWSTIHGAAGWFTEKKRPKKVT